ncbi:hypothetical protein AADZ84_14120 [Colwelliaceae bacterium MEBiC 14330]
MKNCGATTTNPIILYGKRHIRPDMIEQYKRTYQDFAQSVYGSNSEIKAVFSFPDKKEPSAYWQVVWVNSIESFSLNLVDSSTFTQLQETYLSTEEYPDLIRVYGGWNENIVSESKEIKTLYFDFLKSSAGFMKQDGAGEAGPALLGFTVRHIKPGRLAELATSFQAVCDLWYEKIPGILMAAVFPDTHNPTVVHDLRLFANHQAYLAHTDKSDKKLTSAMSVWFENYDTSIPFSGQLYAANTQDEALHTSSIKRSTTPRAQLETFHFGESSMLGIMPNMTRNNG